MDKAKTTEIGGRLRKQREFLGLSRETFAERVSLSPQFIAEIELGKKGLSLDTLLRICECFEISADYLLFGNRTRPIADTPLDTLLRELPPDYLPMAENMLGALHDTIQIAKSDHQK